MFQVLYLEYFDAELAHVDTQQEASVDDGEIPAETGAIDMHAHFLSPGYRAALAAAGIDQLDGMPNGIPAWSTESALALMDGIGVATSVLSVSSPGLLLPGGEPIALARTVNDEAAEVARSNPGRFRFVASLPLPDVDAALDELHRASTDLSAAGVLLLTNYGGSYLGDHAFEPLFHELNRRGSLVVIHPTSPCTGAESLLGYPPPLLEFIFDTTRAVVNLTLSGTLARCPSIRFVVPHGGAALPVLADRVGRVSATLSETAARSRSTSGKHSAGSTTTWPEALRIPSCRPSWS